MAERHNVGCGCRECFMWWRTRMRSTSGRCPDCGEPLDDHKSVAVSLKPYCPVTT